MSGNLATAAHPFRRLPGGRAHVCACGRARGYRTHQPCWWRLLHPFARWR